MAYDSESDLEAFRASTREWLEANCPPSMRTPITNEAERPWGGRKFKWVNPEAKLWLDRMAEKGWTAPAWPREYGGGGLSKAEARVLEQEHIIYPRAVRHFVEDRLSLVDGRVLLAAERA